MGVKPIMDFDLNALLVTRRVKSRILGLRAAVDTAYLTASSEFSHRQHVPVTLRPSSIGRRAVAVHLCDDRERDEATVASSGGSGFGGSTDALEGGSLREDLRARLAAASSTAQPGCGSSVGLGPGLGGRGGGAGSARLTRKAMLSGKSIGTKLAVAAPDAAKASLTTLSKGASSFVKNFRKLRSTMGMWMFKAQYKTAAAVEEALRGLGDHVTSFLSPKHFDTISREITADDALYYADDSLNRFVARISVRIHSSDVDIISYRKNMAAATAKTQDAEHFSKHSNITSHKLGHVHARSTAVGSVGPTTSSIPPAGAQKGKGSVGTKKGKQKKGKKGKSGKVEKGNGAKSDNDEKPMAASASVPSRQRTTIQGEATIAKSRKEQAHESAMKMMASQGSGDGLGAFMAEQRRKAEAGSVLETCCVYTSTLQEDGTVKSTHLGVNPYPSFVSRVELEKRPYVRIREYALQQNQSGDPTHKKFSLYEDVMIDGTEIILKVP